MKYKIFASQEGILTAVSENDHIKQVAQLQFGDKEVGVIEANQEEHLDREFINFIENYGL